MQNAYIAGTIVALGAGVMGYFMVLRGQSFAGHSLANVGFAGATGAVYVGMPPIVGMFIAGAIAAFGMHVLGLGVRHTHRSDIAIGAVLTASLAVGFLFVSLAAKQYAVNIYSVLFGNVLGISDSDVLTMGVTVAVLLTIAILSARPLLFASIDPDVAAARGVPVRWLGLGFLLLLAMVVAVAVQIVGVLLIFSLLVTPAATARRLSPRPARAIVISVALALAFTWLGLTVGYYTDYPDSFYITTFAFGTYLAVRGGEGLALQFRRYAKAKVTQ